MLFKFSAVAALSLAVLASPASADHSMRCVFPKAGGGDFVMGEVVFSHKSGEAEATLRSTITDYFKMGEVKARVVKDDPKILVLSWTVNAKNGENQYTKMKYSLKIMGDGKKAYYRAQPLSYNNEFNNSGSCTSK